MATRFFQNYMAAIEKVKKDTREQSIIIAVNGLDASIQTFQKDLQLLDQAPLNLEDLLVCLKETPEKSLAQLTFEMRENIRAEIIMYLSRLCELKAELLARRT